MTEKECVQSIAERFKKQYCNRKKWDTFDTWHIQPEELYLIMKELKTFAAVEALTNSTWVEWHRKRFNAEQRRKNNKP